MIPIDEHDPRLLPSPVFQIHTPRKFHPSIVPLALVSPHPEISPSATLDTTPSGTLCRRPHDSPASVPCFILLQPFQGPLRIRETSRLPNNPLRTACIHPSRQAAGHSAKPFGKTICPELQKGGDEWQKTGNEWFHRKTPQKNGSAGQFFTGGFMICGGRDTGSEAETTTMVLSLSTKSIASLSSLRRTF